MQNFRGEVSICMLKSYRDPKCSEKGCAYLPEIAMEYYLKFYNCLKYLSFNQESWQEFCTLAIIQNALYFALNFI